ncbi:Lcl C-terminal domain-containing protein [Desulfolutivibrio sp.]|uniref:Lcl C-terminal domain-containing protein n=1 Tax=Desulfolutivibrio sp. TaxID=2773296 RepID=UPI002F967852
MAVKFSLFRYSAVRSRFLRGAAICLGFLSLLVLDAPAWAEYRLPDTGQTKCYDNNEEIPCPSPGQAFYGQDANYAGKQPAYQNNGSTITDLITGLIWQQADDGVARTFDEAATYCQDLDQGGYDDWRLPFLKELLSIVDAGRSSPAINPVFTSSSSTDIYWSGTEYASSSSYAWGVNFYAGASVYNAKTLGGSKVRCVRGEFLPGSAYVDNGDGTVTDKSTGLVWEKGGSASGMSWETALTWCENATTGDYADWRLPNKRELEILVDVSRNYPAIDPAFTESGGLYWSGTTYNPAGFQYSAWRVNFSDGKSREYGKSSSFYSRCVRGGFGSFAPSIFNVLLLDVQ